MIPFNSPPILGTELNYIKQALTNKKLSGDGHFTKQCQKWFEINYHIAKTLLTTSGTAALDMAALLLNIHTGDEVIMPSFTFVSTANAFALRGAKIVFVDIRPDTMNIDETLIEAAITSKTKAIVPVHYAGVSCEMDIINQIAKKYNIAVIEDAAQGVHAKYKDQALGTIGDIGCFSFHETKNYTMGEGGAILLKHPKMVQNAEIIWEKGTNRSQFFRGQVDKYTWVDLGSSYLPSEINAAYLYAQLEAADQINQNRLNSWNMYYKLLSDLKQRGDIELPVIPDYCQHNAHMFYIKVKDLNIRTKLISFLKENGILAVFHYIPLHTSPAGKKYGYFSEEDQFTTQESNRLLRLPMYYCLTPQDIEYVSKQIHLFFQ